MPHMTKISNSSAGSDILSSATTNPSSVDEYHDSRQLHVASQPPSLGPISPAIAGFNFGSEPTSPTSPNAPVQFSNSLNQSMKQDDWGIDASQNGRGEIEKQKKSQEESRKRTQYFDDQFAYKDGSVSSTAERVRYESPVIAELRTNVIVKDEYSLVTDLSAHIAMRYQRSEQSVMITLTHSACLLFSGTFEPAYILNITAIESHCQPATNKRNTALIQSFLSETVGVTPDRGVVRFQAIKDECLGTNGRTITGEIDKLEAENGGKKLSKTDRKKSTGSGSSRRKTFNGNDSSSPEKDSSKMPKSNNRKSFMHLSRKSPDEPKSSDNNRASLHPPNVDLNAPVSPSSHSTPDMPSPVFVQTAVQQPLPGQTLAPDQSPRMANNSGSDVTGRLLSEALEQLSQEQNGAQTNGAPTNGAQQQSMPHHQQQFDAQHFPVQAASTQPPQPGFTNHSRPNSARKSYLDMTTPPSQVVFGGGDLPPLLPPPPAIPQDKPPEKKISKRKSLINMFRRDKAT